jgi:hypothetical protein
VIGSVLRGAIRKREELSDKTSDVRLRLAPLVNTGILIRRRSSHF